MLILLARPVTFHLLSKSRFDMTSTFMCRLLKEKTEREKNESMNSTPH